MILDETQKKTRGGSKEFLPGRVNDPIGEHVSKWWQTNTIVGFQSDLFDGLVILWAACFVTVMSHHPKTELRNYKLFSSDVCRGS